MIRHGIDITKEKVRICNDLSVEDGYIEAECEAYFNIAQWLGIEVNNKSVVHLFPRWKAETNNVTCIVGISAPDINSGMEIRLDEEEKIYFRNLMEDYSEKLTLLSLSELYNSYS